MTLLMPWPRPQRGAAFARIFVRGLLPSAFIVVAAPAVAQAAAPTYPVVLPVGRPYFDLRERAEFPPFTKKPPAKGK